MSRVSINIEVPDDVYNEVVLPMRRNKKFGRLVRTLLSGYMSDGYIHAFGDDQLDEYTHQSMNELDSMLDDAQVTLSELGMNLDNMQAMADSEKAYLKKKAEHSKSFTFHGGRQSREDEEESVRKAETSANDNTDEEVDDLRDKLSKLTDIVTAMANNQSSMNSQYTAPQPQPQSQVQPVQQPATPQPAPAQVHETVQASKSEEHVEEAKPKAHVVEDNSEDSGNAADDLMASLLNGNTYSF